MWVRFPSPALSTQNSHGESNPPTRFFGSKLWNRAMFQAFKNKRARKLLFSQAIQDWLAYNRRYTQRTQEHYRSVIYSFADFTGIHKAKQLQRGHFEDYITQLLSKFCNRTGNAHLTVLKSFNRWLSSNYNVPNFATTIPMLKEDPPQTTSITKAEYRKILAYCVDGKADTIKLLANTGVRASELCRLTSECVKDKTLFVRGKGRKLRTVPLNQTCCDIFSKPKTFINLTKSNRKQLYLLCRQVGQRAGIHLTPQVLRRYFATELLRGGVDISIVSALLGHSSIKTTQGYIHNQPIHFKNVTDCLIE